MGAGKSTYSKVAAAESSAVLVSEDEWLAAHYPNQIQTFDDYIQFSTAIKPFIKRHIQSILKTGDECGDGVSCQHSSATTVVYFICSELGCEHELVYLDLSDSQCLSQIAKRRTEQPERAQFDTEAVFHHVTQYFEPPTSDENLNIVRVENKLN